MLRVLGLALPLLLAGCLPLARFVPATGIGKPAPEIRLVDVRTNETVSLADYRGKTVLLNVWATWCTPCRREMPALDALQRERPDDLAVLFVSDEALELIHAWMADVPGEGRHLRADTDAWRGPYAGAAAQRPVSFLIDADGLLRERIVGAETEQGFRQRLNGLGV